MTEGIDREQMARRIAERIRVLRERGIKFENKDVAELAGCNPRTVGAMYRGYVRMTDTVLFWTAIKLGLTSDYIIGLSDEV